MQSWCVLVISITTLDIWSEPKGVASECFSGHFITPNCTFNCYDEQLAFVIESVTNVWNESYENCKESGLSLSLDNIDFPNNTLFEGWFVPDIILNYLSINLANIDKIEMDAFNSNSFSTVKELRITTSLKSLENGIFNGFTLLKTLALSFAALPELISTNLLSAPSATLRKMRIYGGGKDFVNPNYNIFKLDNVTGSGALSTLEDLRVLIPLNDSITRKSFVGLTNIVKIELEYCQITAIGSGSFDSIGPNLTSLILTNNKITTLPNDLFQRILLNAVADFKITLANNDWNCDCHLINFQKYLIDYRQYFDELLITCKSPSEKQFKRINDTIIEQDDECALAKECYSDFSQHDTSAQVYINVPRASVSLVQTNTGDLVISSEIVSNVPTFLWYRRDENDEEINCIRGFNITIKTTSLSENIPYTFCYIDEYVGSASPFDCITYIKMGAEPQLWYTEKTKIYAIAVIIASLLLSLILGMVAGIKFKKIKQRMIIVHNYGTKVNKISIEMSTPPPLPDRPNTLGEINPEYAYVR